eukprot:117396_1
MTEIYDFNSKIWTKLASMFEEREYAGICYDKFGKERVYVGGGYNVDRSFEYYNIIKNEWYLLPKTNGDHDYHSMVWMDDINIVNIASVHSGLFERLDIRKKK